MMRKTISLLTAITIFGLWTSCKDDKSEPETITKEMNIVMNDNLSNELTFHPSGEWMVSVSDTSNANWCKASPVSGGKGSVDMIVTADINNTFNDREAILTLEAPYAVYIIHVLQKKGNGIADINMPDAKLKAYCLENYDTDKNKKISYKEVSELKEVNFAGRDIVSLEGIEYFEALESLNCSNNRIAALNLKRNTKLKNLICYSNKLTSLDLSSNRALTTFTSYGNWALTELWLANGQSIASIEKDDHTEIKYK